MRKDTNTMLQFTIQQLCNVSNSILVNGENHHWYDEVFEQGQIHFINQNNGEQFSILAHDKAVSYENGVYTFELDDGEYTVELEFYKHSPVTEEDI